MLLVKEEVEFIQIQQHGLEILHILITSQCTTIISGMMLMETIL